MPEPKPPPLDAPTAHGQPSSSLGVAHRRRLRALWHSAGWPSHDAIEVELLTAGWVQRLCDAHGRDTLRVTDLGLQILADTLAGNRSVRDAHEALVARVATEMQRTGRLVWCGLSLRARTEAGWQVAMPDVFSIRHTTVESQVQPVVHEIKVRRADLLADLRRPTKAQAYQALASQCWYVLGEGVGHAEDVPEPYGVMRSGIGGGPFEVLRPAAAREMSLPLATWMALARATPRPMADDPQQPLCPCDDGEDDAPSAGGSDPAHNSDD